MFYEEIGTMIKFFIQINQILIVCIDKKVVSSMIFYENIDRLIEISICFIEPSINILKWQYFKIMVQYNIQNYMASIQCHSTKTLILAKVC